MIQNLFDEINNIIKCFKRVLDVRSKSCDIPSGVLNKTTKLMHGGIGVIISGNTKIGKNVLIGQNVTIGNNYNEKEHSTTIEDNVMIFGHSIIFGKITIGHDSIVAAGSVVYKDVPPYSLVYGYNKIIKDKYRKL